MDRLEYKGRRITHNIQSLLLQGKKLWIGTFDEGIYLYDISHSSIISHYFSGLSAEGLISNCVVQFFDLHDGRMLTGTSNGLFLFNSTEETFRPIPGLEYQFVHNIYQLTDGTLLVATLSNGLYKLHKSGVSFVGEKLQTTQSDLCMIFEDASHRLWLGTNTNGLFLYDMKTQTTTPFDSNLSRPNIGVYRILEDGNGQLWISTSDGLFSLNKNSSEVIRYGLHNALPTDQFNFNSGFQDAKGCMFFGSLKGLVTFNPSMLHHQLKDMKVYFTDIEQTDASLSVNFAVPVFSSSQSVWFRYRLEGVDNDWIVTQGKQKIKYNNLVPGHYMLYVEASTTNGLWKGDCSSLEIHIPYSPFTSPLAITLYCLIIIGLVMFAIYKYRKKSASRRINEKEATTEIVDINELDKQFLIDLTQFIASSLTSPDLSVEFLASHANMSLSTFYRKVKGLTSMSPQEFIRHCRLKRSAELLSSGDISIKMVAEATGFSSVNYFSSCFMKQFGVTPGKFRSGKVTGTGRLDLNGLGHN